MRGEMRRNTCIIPTVISIVRAMGEVETEERRTQVREGLWKIPVMSSSGRRILLIGDFKK